MILFNLSFSYMSFCNILIVVDSISMYHVIFVYCSLIDDVLCTSQNKILFCSVYLVGLHQECVICVILIDSSPGVRSFTMVYILPDYATFLSYCQFSTLRHTVCRTVIGVTCTISNCDFLFACPYV